MPTILLAPPFPIEIRNDGQPLARFSRAKVKPTDYPQLKQVTWEKVATDPPRIFY
jgi:hypothetical protein